MSNGILTERGWSELTKYGRFVMISASVTPTFLLAGTALSGSARGAVVTVGVFWFIVLFVGLWKLRSKKSKAMAAILALFIMFVIGSMSPSVETTTTSTLKSAPIEQGTTEKAKATTGATTRTITEKETIPYQTVRKDDATLTKGQEKTTQAGTDGEKTITYDVVIGADGKEISRKKTKDEVTKTPVDMVIAVGTYVAPAPYYVNCDAARDAGVAPIYEGQPGYRSKLDRDHDGIACE